MAVKHCFILFWVLAILAACNERTQRKGGFSVHGIDVSHYQKQIGWSQMSAQDICFAFVKATEGQSMQDSFFCKNWDAMRNVGLVRGAYHFYRPSISAEEQAINFISTVDLQHGDLPPVIDIEVTEGFSSEAIVNGVKTWLDIVGEHWKIRPIVYTNQKFYNQYLAGALYGYPVWLARYSEWHSPDMVDGYSWHFWQYGCQGQVTGITGDVDLNVFNGSLNDLHNLTLQRPTPLLNRMPEPLRPSLPAKPSAQPGEPIAANP